MLLATVCYLGYSQRTMFSPTSEQKSIDQLLNCDLFSWKFVQKGYCSIIFSSFVFCSIVDLLNWLLFSQFFVQKFCSIVIVQNDLDHLTGKGSYVCFMLIYSIFALALPLGFPIFTAITAVTSKISLLAIASKKLCY